MSYTRRYVTIDKKGRKHVTFRSMGALGGASDCGSGQTWYPNLTFAGFTGQCSTPAQAQAALSSGQATGNLNTAASTDSGFNWGTAGSVAGNLLTGLFGPKPAGPAVAPQTGMSTTTKVALAGAGVLALALILKRRD